MWEFNQERRSSTRHEAKLEVRVLLVATKKSASGEEQVLPLMGQTRDISQQGLGLLVSAKSMSLLYNLGDNYMLQLVLTLPVGSIELEVSPARYQHINEGAAGSRILIGAQITRISDDDREKLNRYLESIQ